MNIVKKRIVLIILLIMPFLVVVNRLHGMEDIKQSILKKLVAGGFGVVVGGVGGYLIGNSNDLEKVKLKGKVARLIEQLKKSRTKLVVERRQRLALLKILGILPDAKRVPEKITFALNLYDAIKMELKCYKNYRLEKYSVKEVLELYKHDVGGLGLICKFFAIVDEKKKVKIEDLPKNFKKIFLGKLEEDVFARTLRDIVKKELACEEGYQLTRLSAKNVLDFYKYEVGGMKLICDLFARIKEKDSMMVNELPENYKKIMLKFVKDSASLIRKLGGKDGGLLLTLDHLRENADDLDNEEIDREIRKKKKKGREKLSTRMKLYNKRLFKK